jgi:ferredoxin
VFQLDSAGLVQIASEVPLAETDAVVAAVHTCPVAALTQS